MKIYGRKYRLVVGTQELSSFPIRFRAKRTLEPTPNTCEIEIDGLSTDTARSFLANHNNAVVSLTAGYDEVGVSEIYLGQPENIFVERKDAGLTLHIQSSDGAQQFSQATIRTPIAPGETLGSVVGKVTSALKLPLGTSDRISGLLAKVTTSLFPRGGALSGKASDELTRITQSANLEWSVQNGAIQILPRNAPLSGRIVLLSSDTGLIGSPKVVRKKDKPTEIECTCLLLPDIVPGRLVQLQSEFFTGAIKARDVEYTGDTHGEPWFCQITAELP